MAGSCELSFCNHSKVNNLFTRSGLLCVKEELLEEQLQASQKPIGLLQKLRL